jgi:hypothetical protein
MTCFALLPSHFALPRLSFVSLFSLFFLPLNRFKYNTALGPPYHVLVDTNFLNFSIKNKLEVRGLSVCVHVRLVAVTPTCAFFCLSFLCPACCFPSPRRGCYLFIDSYQMHRVDFDVFFSSSALFMWCVGLLFLHVGGSLDDGLLVREVHSMRHRLRHGGTRKIRLEIPGKFTTTRLSINTRTHAHSPTDVIQV